MRLISTFLLVILIACSRIGIAQHTTLTLPETGNTISLRFRPILKSNETFSSIQIDSATKYFKFAAKNPIARIPATSDERKQAGFWVNIPGLTLHPARYFMVGKYGTDTEPHTLLFFISEAGASDAAALLVIGFSKAGEPYKVLERDYLDVTSFQSTDSDTALIIGKASLSQVMSGEWCTNIYTKPYATTYDPFSVFIVHTEGKAVYSLSKSRSYNQEHYVWAGPHSREDYAVAYNVPTHRRPFGMPASKLDALLGESKCK